MAITGMELKSIVVGDYVSRLDMTGCLDCPAGRTCSGESINPRLTDWTWERPWSREGYGEGWERWRG